MAARKHGAPHVLEHGQPWKRVDDLERAPDTQARDPVWRGAYADAGACDAGQVVVLRYPLRSVSEQVEVNRELLTVDWKGDTVLDVRPRGATPVPYQRGALAGAPIPWQAAPTYPPLAQRLSPLA